MAADEEEYQPLVVEQPYDKRTDFVYGLAGAHYQVNVIIDYMLNGLTAFRQHQIEFELKSELDECGALDDVVMTSYLSDAQPNCSVVCVQVKHGYDTWCKYRPGHFSNKTSTAADYDQHNVRLQTASGRDKNTSTKKVWLGKYFEDWYKEVLGQENKFVQGQLPVTAVASVLYSNHALADNEEAEGFSNCFIPAQDGQHRLCDAFIDGTGEYAANFNVAGNKGVKNRRKFRKTLFANMQSHTNPQAGMSRQQKEAYFKSFLRQFRFKLGQDHVDQLEDTLKAKFAEECQTQGGVNVYYALRFRISRWLRAQQAQSITQTEAAQMLAEAKTLAITLGKVLGYSESNCRDLSARLTDQGHQIPRLAALNALRDTINQRQGLTVLTGPTGIGKSCLMLQFIQQEIIADTLAEHCLYLTSSQVDDQLLEVIATIDGISCLIIDQQDSLEFKPIFAEVVRNALAKNIHCILACRETALEQLAAVESLEQVPQVLYRLAKLTPEQCATVLEQFADLSVTCMGKPITFAQISQFQASGLFQTLRHPGMLFAACRAAAAQVQLADDHQNPENRPFYVPPNLRKSVLAYDLVELIAHSHNVPIQVLTYQQDTLLQQLQNASLTQMHSSDDETRFTPDVIVLNITDLLSNAAFNGNQPHTLTALLQLLGINYDDKKLSAQQVFLIVVVGECQHLPEQLQQILQSFPNRLMLVNADINTLLLEGECLALTYLDEDFSCVMHPASTCQPAVFCQQHTACQSATWQDLLSKIPQQPVGVVAEAGIGKTRLCEELRQVWLNQPFSAQCPPWLVLLEAQSLRFNEAAPWNSFCDYLLHKFQLPTGSWLAQAFKIDYDVGRVLVVFDALDELDPRLRDTRLVQQALAHQNIIHTTRPGYQGSALPPKQFTLAHFSASDVQKYIQSYFAESLTETGQFAQQLVDLVSADNRLVALLATPLNCRLYCEAALEHQGQVGHLAELYQWVTLSYLKKALINYGMAEGFFAANDAVTLIYDFNRVALTRMSQVAFQQIFSGALTGCHAALNQIVMADSVRDDHVVRINLITGRPVTNDDNTVSYQFGHKTIAEYFAACWIVQFLSDTRNDRVALQALITQLRYEPRYEIVWQFVAEITALGDLMFAGTHEALPYFWEALLAQPQDLIGVRHGAVVRQCLCYITADDFPHETDLLEQLQGVLTDHFATTTALAVVPQIEPVPVDHFEDAVGTTGEAQILTSGRVGEYVAILSYWSSAYDQHDAAFKLRYAAEADKETAVAGLLNAELVPSGTTYRLSDIRSRLIDSLIYLNANTDEVVNYFERFTKDKNIRVRLTAKKGLYCFKKLQLGSYFQAIVNANLESSALLDLLTPIPFSNQIIDACKNLLFKKETNEKLKRAILDRFSQELLDDKSVLNIMLEFARGRGDLEFHALSLLVDKVKDAALNDTICQLVLSSLNKNNKVVKRFELFKRLVIQGRAKPEQILDYITIFFNHSDTRSAMTAFLVAHNLVTDEHIEQLLDSCDERYELNRLGNPYWYKRRTLIALYNLVNHFNQAVFTYLREALQYDIEYVYDSAADVVTQLCRNLTAIGQFEDLLQLVKIVYDKKRHNAFTSQLKVLAERPEVINFINLAWQQFVQSDCQDTAYLAIVFHLARFNQLALVIREDGLQLFGRDQPLLLLDPQADEQRMTAIRECLIKIRQVVIPDFHALAFPIAHDAVTPAPALTGITDTLGTLFNPSTGSSAQADELSPVATAGIESST